MGFPSNALGINRRKLKRIKNSRFISSESLPQRTNESERSLPKGPTRGLRHSV